MSAVAVILQRLKASRSPTMVVGPGVDVLDIVRMEARPREANRGFTLQLFTPDRSSLFVVRARGVAAASAVLESSP
jgi:hypothetical protein